MTRAAALKAAAFYLKIKPGGSSQKFANTFLRNCCHGCVKNSTQAHYACFFLPCPETAAGKVSSRTIETTHQPTSQWLLRQLTHT